MQSFSLAERVALADTIRQLKQPVAEAVTDQFFLLHPDWALRYGERGKVKGIEDARYHIDHLAGAIEAGNVAPFEEYCRWTAGMQRSRAILPLFLVENLQQVEKALAPSFSEQEGEFLAEFIRVGCKAIEGSPNERKEEESGELVPTRNLFLQTLLLGQRKAAATVVLAAVNAGYAILDIYAEVLQEAMHGVGRMWELNEITVAQEHTATAITQYVLALLYDRLKPAEIRRGKAVITGVEGELHQTGANMVADALESDGWDVRFLGTNMPHEGILQAVQDHKADVVGISATMLFNLPKVRRLMADVRQMSGQKVRVVVGGGAFRSVPNLYAEIGADGSAPGLRETIALLRAVAG